MGMEKKAKAHIDRAMHYGAPPAKKQKLGLGLMMDRYQAYRVLGASDSARSTDPFPERSAKVRYETLKEQYKDDQDKLDHVQCAYDWLKQHKLVDPPLPRAKKQPTKPAPRPASAPPQATGSDIDIRAAYITLGVPIGDFANAKKAYYASALAAHPDRPHGTTDEMQRVNHAWEVLKNAQKFGERYVRPRA